MLLIDEKTPIFEMLVGVAGSGKSTYALARKAELEDITGLKCEIVSSDAIRGELWGDESDQRDPSKVFDVMLARTRKYLSEGYHVIYDACNVGEKYRKHTLHNISSFDCFKRCTIFIVSPEECIKRQEYRERKVPDHVIYRQISQFQVPFWSEGWDDIIIYGEPYSDGQIAEKLSTLRNFDQKNPHHTLPLDEHLIKARNYAVEKKYSEIVMCAALCHDIGKIFTQTIDDDGIAHYYGHENVSAYYYFLLTGDLFNGLEIIWLINHHMDFFKGERYLEKVHRSIENEELWEMLNQLHECDLQAH